MKQHVRSIVNDARRVWWSVALLYVAFSWTYAVLEDKGPIEGLWWGIVTGSTVGYGDFYPETTAGRGVGALLIISMILLLPIAIGHVIAELVHDRNDFTHEEQVESRRVDDETNALVRALYLRLHGREALDAELAAIATRRTGGTTGSTGSTEETA